VPVRAGIGYDAHRFAEGRRLVLGGVEIAHPRGLLGHSDADVLLHAIMDALLGAAALGDIGRHFPDTDETFRGASSVFLLAATRSLLEAEGCRAISVDATVIAEAPRIAPHVPAMRAVIASGLGIAEERVSVKATTQEGLGWIGRGEGIAAIAVAQVGAVAPARRRAPRVPRARRARAR
jgi:2-C-methyl-D-erythritol 2,4-cyclodiphosphate synthase